MDADLKQEVLKLCRENMVQDTAIGYAIYKDTMRIIMTVADAPLSPDTPKHDTRHIRLIITRGGKVIYRADAYINSVERAVVDAGGVATLRTADKDLADIYRAMSSRAREPEHAADAAYYAARNIFTRARDTFARNQTK